MAIYSNLYEARLKSEASMKTESKPFLILYLNKTGRSTAKSQEQCNEYHNFLNRLYSDEYNVIVLPVERDTELVILSKDNLPSEAPKEIKQQLNDLTN